MLDWGKLKEQGRCRDIGISWTEEEAVDIFVKKIRTIEEVRNSYRPEKIAEIEKEMEDFENGVTEDSIIDETKENDDKITSEDEKVNENETESTETIVEQTETETEVETKENEKKDVSDELNELKKQATDLGIKFAANIGVNGLKKKIEANS